MNKITNPFDDIDYTNIIGQSTCYLSQYPLEGLGSIVATVPLWWRHYEYYHIPYRSREHNISDTFLEFLQYSQKVKVTLSSRPSHFSECSISGLKFIKNKQTPGLRDELIRIWWSKVKG